ncbi:type II toxin-antitoxin system Phd/YefM family antitoxin [Sporomusa termitida]|uniref:Antitoxin n=1 Tax=Sporomusa termitida TaxID=2377 RepID=A0A517DVB8_9FIRM|nr:type II toxin-antitoxin system Phd/YefM family antitoxin [Sporomusa termitida]QDR81288.1 hypothetical protein SPTER_26640 [Sporomusa termitida]
MSVIIRPVSDLSKKVSEIESICFEQNSPVYLTKNGSNHMVLTSHEHYEKLLAQLRLYEKLLLAEAENRRGEMLDFNAVMDEIDAEAAGSSGGNEQKVSY